MELSRDTREKPRRYIVYRGEHGTPGALHEDNSSERYGARKLLNVPAEGRLERGLYGLFCLSPRSTKNVFREPKSGDREPSKIC